MDAVLNLLDKYGLEDPAVDSMVNLVMTDLQEAL